MKKFLLATILGFGVFVVGCATTQTAKTDEVSSTAEKTDEMSSSATKANAENLSDEQLNQMFVDCVKNENKNACKRLVNSDSLASVEQCNEKICNNIRVVYERIENYQQAFKHYKKACELNNKFSCHNLSNLYDQGLGVKQNFAKAFKFTKKACDLNLMVACYNVGVYYAEGKGIKQDFINARKYYEKACNENYAMACNNLGVLYVGVKQNKSTAKKYYGKACDLGYQNGCDNYRILNEQGVR